MNKIHYIFLLIIFTACQEKMNNKNLPPSCQIQEKLLSIHNHNRIDNYYWLNKREDPNVIDYLNKENEYTNSQMEDTKEIQKNLFYELKARIKEEDESVPYEFNGYSYWRKFRKGDEHPTYLRKKIESEDEEILLNGNELAKEHDFFDIGDYDISPNNELMAYGFDTLSRRIFQIKIKNLKTGELFNEVLENTTGSMVWANDNKTIFYTKQDQQTLRSNQIFAHQIGT